tara:strand:- start:507 stop:1172 length:666 start_codon:yes stop_codon:yes gene_type:complete
MKEVVLDTETTGLSIKDGHRIVEIGCIELDNLIPTKNVFHCYLNPERQVSKSALEVHGYTDEFLADKKKFKDIAEEFLNFIEGKKIIIHNAEFDIGHLNNELSLINKKNISRENVVDTLEIARNKFPGSGISLDALCKKFRIDNKRRKKHTALLDCELLSKVYINLIGQKEPIFQFNTSIKKNQFMNSTTNNYSKKIIKVSKEEIENHRKFLKTDLKKNFY